MKIVFTSSGENIDEKLDMRFGRAKNFLAYDTETGNYDVYDNKQSLNSAQGAGIQAAEKVCSLKADAVITGHCGPKAFRALSAAGIKVFCSVEQSIKAALVAYQMGELQESKSADVEGHW